MNNTIKHLDNGHFEVIPFYEGDPPQIRAIVKKKPKPQFQFVGPSHWFCKELGLHFFADNRPYRYQMPEIGGSAKTLKEALDHLTGGTPRTLKPVGGEHSCNS